MVVWWLGIADEDTHPKYARAGGVAVEWFTAVTNAIGPAMEDRDNKLAAAPAVLAAIDSVGHRLLKAEAPERLVVRRR